MWMNDFVIAWSWEDYDHIISDCQFGKRSGQELYTHTLITPSVSGDPISDSRYRIAMTKLH